MILSWKPAWPEISFLLSQQGESVDKKNLKWEELAWVRHSSTSEEYLDKFKYLEAKWEKPWKRPGSNLRHQLAQPIGSIALYRLSQIPIYRNRWFIGEF